MVEAEREGLEGASRLVTPHSHLFRILHKAVKLEWSLPGRVPRPPGDCIVFPGPTVARKGAFELREALAGTLWRLMPLGRDLEEPHFWRGVPVAHVEGDWLNHAAVVVQPAAIEDAPRPLLRAIAAGVPVIATPECGLEGLSHVTTVRFGDVEDLRQAITQVLKAATTPRPTDHS